MIPGTPVPLMIKEKRMITLVMTTAMIQMLPRFPMMDDVVNVKRQTMMYQDDEPAWRKKYEDLPLELLLLLWWLCRRRQRCMHRW